MAQNRPLGNASSLGGSFERLEHYLSWPLKLCKFTGWKKLEVLQGLFEQRPENPALFSALRVFLQQGTAALLWGGTGRHSVPQSTGPPQGLPSHPCLAITLFGWLHSLHFTNMIKRTDLKKKKAKRTNVTSQA